MNGKKNLWMSGKICMCGKGAYTIGAGAEAKKIFMPPIILIWAATVNRILI